MDRTTQTRAAAGFVVAGALAVIVMAAAAGVAANDGADPSPTPTPIVTPAPTPAPTASPMPVPTATPPATQIPDGFVVDLDTADANDVSVVIDDPTGSIVGARSGRAGEGMSVRWNDIVVENVDEDTLRLTWTGWPIDEVITVSVAPDGEGYDLTFTQKMPYENTDAMGADRVLIVDVATAVSAEDVSARFVPGA
jgi:hypothetical protein